MASIDEHIRELEALMNSADFWNDREKAQATIKKIAELKAEKEGGIIYDRGSAVLTIFSGAGGDDAEDFSRMLFDMYRKFIEKKGWSFALIHKNDNDHGGFRNITIDIVGKGAYGTMKNESGVHRLVRVSPFNAKGLRHTSFSLVEVIPKLPKTGTEPIPADELQIEFARSSGPGGQNVNKRETAVRIVHTPTGLSAHSSNQRSQLQNKETALEILTGKLYKLREEERVKREKGMYISKTTEIEWGNQIRSYVLHPYKMVKDHRTNYETSNVDKVMNGEIEGFIEAERNL